MPKVIGIYVDGVFDMFHEGHRNIIRNAIKDAKALHPDADIIKVFVGICDKGCETYKRKPIMTLAERKKAITRFVTGLKQANDGNNAGKGPEDNQPELDFEIIENSPVKLTAEFILKNRFSIVYHGNDFDVKKTHLYYPGVNDQRVKCELRRLDYTKGVSTTQMIVELWRKGRCPSSPNVASDLGLAETELAKRIQGRSIGDVLKREDDLRISPEKYFANAPDYIRGKLKAGR